MSRRASGPAGFAAQRMPRRTRVCAAASTLACVLTVAGCSGDPELGLGEESVQPDEAAIAREMIDLIKEVSLARSADGQPLRRFNQVKSLGCLDASFTVPDNLAAKLRQGIFARPGTYRAVLRFANASTLDDRKKDLRGVSIKIPEFRDAALADGEVQELDFLFNSYPALFAGTPEDFLSFVSATAADRRWLFFLTHPGALMRILRARANPASPFDIRYFSTTPFRYGDQATTAVKYSLAPCSDTESGEPDEPDADYLSGAMAKHLEQAPACFDFMVQFQSDAAEMPIEDASVIWDEDISPFNAVARIVIENQSFRDEASVANCEAMQFNPWNALEAHKPLGGINRVRDKVYDEIGRFRAAQNAARQR